MGFLNTHYPCAALKTILPQAAILAASYFQLGYSTNIARLKRRLAGAGLPAINLLFSPSLGFSWASPLLQKPPEFFGTFHAY